MLSSTMRLFVALDIEPEIREKIRHFVEKLRELAFSARWVSAESMHVTLKFIGEKPENLLERIQDSLASIQGPTFELRFSGTGFFPTPNSARVFWIGIQEADALAKLANSVEDSLAKIGIPKEDRAFSPHLTLARASGGRSGAPGWRKGDRPNRQFAKLQEYLATHPAPEFGTMTAHEFFLYRSQLSPKGSQYTKLARFELRPASE